jgi:hypothetical protein
MFRDFRYAFRTLAKAPGFLAIAVSTLAVGIGANTAVFSALNSLLIRPLPYADPDRLVIAGEVNAEKGLRTGVSRTTFEQWRTRTNSFEGLAAFVDNQVFPFPGNADSLRGSRVSENFFDVLGVRAMFGADLCSR